MMHSLSMMTNVIAFYHYHNDNRYIISRLVNDELAIIDYTFNSSANPHNQQQMFYNLLLELNVDQDTIIGICNSNNMQCEFESYLSLARMLLNFKQARFNVTKMIQRINHYHKYVRHRQVSEYDVNKIFSKLVESQSVKWITHKDEIMIGQKSLVSSIAYKRSILSLYYMMLKSKISQYAR